MLAGLLLQVALRNVRALHGPAARLPAHPVLTGKSCAVGKQFVPFILLRRRRRSGGGGVEFASCIRILSAHTPHARAIGSE